MKKLLLSAVVASTIITSSNADFLGAEVGYAAWAPELTGNIRNGSNSVDFERDLGFGSKESNYFIWAQFDHPLPLLPNIKVQQTNYSDQASGIFNTSFTYAGTTVNSNIQTNTELTLNQLDIIPYWRILDNWVNLDLGFNFKKIDGKFKVSNSNATVDEKFNVIIPMLYAKARFDMPFTGLSVEADISYVGYEGNNISDMKGGVVYESSYGLGATAGIRKQSLSIDDIDSTYGDINIEGFYAGLFYHF